MAIIDTLEPSESATRQQRWSHFLTLLLAVLSLLYGLNMRNGILGSTVLYTNVRAGIRANYPQNWLIDESGDYVFRVRDMARLGFKTTIQVRTIPVGANATPGNVLTTLNINRSQTFVGYKALSRENLLLADDTSAVSFDYYFVDFETNAFLESPPVVVLGRDIVTIRGGQAIIVSFWADAQTFDADVATFNRFLNRLEFS